MNWPFSAWHKLAVNHFRLDPIAFWDMPLADWLSLIETDAPALDRAALAQLMKDNPDD